MRTQEEILSDETMSNTDKAKKLCDNTLKRGAKEGKSEIWISTMKKLQSLSLHSQSLGRLSDDTVIHTDEEVKTDGLYVSFGKRNASNWESDISEYSAD